ncbi:MAG TPA: hypothetical protein VHG08_08965 [Longimicrobium sp.]|nr:hypothetical protein [Longimicrobium sp.]
MRISSLSLLAAALALAACDGGTGSRPAGGEYIVTLESPNGHEGAAILEMTDQGVESVTASAAALFRNRISGGYRLVLVREPAGPLQFRIRLAEGNDFPDVRVIEVVDGQDQRRPSVEGYQVSFTRTRGNE